MKPVHVRVHPSKADLPREEQLAWKIAAVAADPVAVPDETAEMVVNWVIDNAAVAIASVNRHPRMSARDMASAHPAAPGRAGAAVFGMEANIRVSPEWAAWANGTAVRELDMHDTFLAADYSHPGDNIPPILAVGQHLNLDGQALLRGLAAGYEIHIDLVRAICLHEHKIDHIAHLCPAQAAGRHRRQRPAEDGPARQQRTDTIRLWHKIRTVEDPKWTERYHAKDHNQLAFDGRIAIRMKDGSEVVDEMAVANAHPLGATPWKRADYVGKFRSMTEGLIEDAEAKRFLEACEALPMLKAGELHRLLVVMPPGTVRQGRPAIF